MSRASDFREGRPLAALSRRKMMTAMGGALSAVAVGRLAWAKAQRPPMAGGARRMSSAGVGPPSGDETRELSGNDAREARRYDRERKYLQTRYGRIAYVERGQGEAVILLHGFPLSGFQWRGVIDRLCAQRRCVAPDFMGLGFSHVAAGQDVSPAAQAEMIAAFLDGLGIRRADIIANDSGGAVAQLFVARYGARARTLLLTNCDVETDSPPQALLPIIDLARGGLFTELYLRPWLHDRGALRSSSDWRLCYSDPERPSDAAIGEYLAPLLSSPERSALTNRFAASLAPNPLAGITESLRRCQVPTRIVWGMGDGIFSPDNIEYLVSVLPRVTGIRKIPEAKLFFPEEMPDVIAWEAATLWRDQV
jgi:haloalkane dehalogenase